MPFLVDAPLALVAHRRPDIAAQLELMNVEAFSLSLFSNRALKLATARARPGREQCSGPDRGEYACGTEDANASMPSGHAQFVATAAGLTCVHHRYLPLWGSPAADTSACALMVTAAVVTAASRVVGDRHYASDVLVGAALGFGIGYGTPWLLHYRHGRTSGDSPRAVLLPLVSGDSLGAMAVSTF
jgi:membrane-associated phospholipid phosphatase